MTEQIKIDFEKTIKASDLSEGDVSLKKKFFNSFITKGFPSKKLENWKFLDISQIIKKDIGELSFFNDYSPINKIDESVFVKDLEHNKIVFINGKVERINFKYEDQDKIEINESSKLEDKFKNSNSLIDLNNAFINKIYKILVKKDYSLKKPLIVYHLTNNEIQSKNINIRLQFQLEQNSSLRLIDFFNHNSEKNFINVFYNFELKKNAILKNYKLDRLQNKNI